MPSKRILALWVFLFLLPLHPARAGEGVPAYIDLKDAPTITVDWSKGNTQAVTLHGDRKLVFENGQKGGRYMLILKQDTTGSRTVKWPSSIQWPGGPPQSGGTPANILTTTANRKDFFTFFYDGVSYDVLGMSQNY